MTTDKEKLCELRGCIYWNVCNHEQIIRGEAVICFNPHEQHEDTVTITERFTGADND